jgi:hypothetical protein
MSVNPSRKERKADLFFDSLPRCLVFVSCVARRVILAYRSWSGGGSFALHGRGFMVVTERKEVQGSLSWGRGWMTSCMYRGYRGVYLRSRELYANCAILINRLTSEIELLYLSRHLDTL